MDSSPGVQEARLLQNCQGSQDISQGLGVRDKD